MLETLFSWKTLWYSAIVVYVPACIGLIVIVLLQKGKGAGFAGSFGAGAGPGSETVFGPRAGQSLPVKLTYIFAAIFVAISLGLSLVAPQVRQADAPELIEGAEGTAPTQISTELDELGLGTGRAGIAAPESTPELTSDEEE